MTKKIVFASYAPDDVSFTFHHEDQALLRDPLAVRHIAVDTIPWMDKKADWAAYDAVIVRSTWDYHWHYAEFQAWLDRLERENVKVLNGLPILRWNMDKTYLAQLAQHGVPTLPTEFYAKGQSADLSAIIARHGWSQGVVKPTVSAGGDNTWRFTPDEASAKQADFDAQLQQMSVMVQQFAKQISTGEWSFLFFNGVYSHAVQKVPAEGEMFVHEHRGGSTHSVQPATHLVGQASNVVRIVQELTGELPLYARVDTVIAGDNLVLMELECVEPYLYMPYGDPYTVERVADAIAQRV